MRSIRARSLAARRRTRRIKDEETYLRIGDRNIIREYAQIHRGTAAGSATVLGNDNFLMATSHVGHNCVLSDNVIIANGALLGGYVEVGKNVFISGNCVVHQFVRIGDYALLRGLSGTSRDVPPFAIVDWQHTVRGVNVVGLKRAGFDEKRIREIRQAFRVLFRSGRNLALAVKEVEKSGRANSDVLALLEFINSSKRGSLLRRRLRPRLVADAMVSGCAASGAAPTK